MRISISHRTTYSYETPVSYALQRIRLRPSNSALQTVADWRVTVEGGRVETGYSDHHGNRVDLLSADAGTQSLSITVAGEVDTHDRAGTLGKVYGRAPLWYWRQPTALTEAGTQITALIDGLEHQANEIDTLHALSAAIIARVPYVLNQTGVETTAEQAVIQRSGVCQDHANIFVSGARKLGMPARYVSGYLYMDDRVDQEASHAWAEVHVDDLGWVGFDVSNGISPDPRYVRLAVGRDAQEAAPISGLRMGSGDEQLIVSLQVQQ
ncbi:transglutaminase family protein [Sulfitobacter albidus]|uniref:Transglutaminase family protein n=1 Tax=Sulfitobacter albidus TaxID=2829501 RepID=A0A975JDL1_9RHOB|nr:transglutaminase family protein [Sulfitobacter albidus]QUJ76407.1 transglutaminase family protein [Sulfitobacter albidus]